MIANSLDLRFAYWLGFQLSNLYPWQEYFVKLSELWEISMVLAPNWSVPLAYCSINWLTRSSIYTHFNTMKKKGLGKHCGKRWNLLKMSKFTFSHNVFYTICIWKFFNSHTSFVVCKFFEFGPVSKWCVREGFYSLPNDKILDQFKFKAIADDKLNPGWGDFSFRRIFASHLCRSMWEK